MMGSGVMPDFTLVHFGSPAGTEYVPASEQNEEEDYD